MSDVLKKILDVKRTEVATAKAVISEQALREQIADLPRCRNFYHAVNKKNPRGINVIAEIKKASPSAGLIRADFDPVKLGRLYAEMGADAISVLTDETFFQGRLEYLQQVKAAVDVPVLRKEFIIDPYQVYEARAAGADAILLIAEALEPGKLMDLQILAQELTLSVLLEVHEMESLLQLRSLVGFPLGHYTLLGINNRNLKTMHTDLNHSLRLAELAQNQEGLVSESGIKTRADVQKLINAGFAGVLIGETLMRAEDMRAKFKELFDSPK